ncbi:hypothetical protein M406DRAFT_91260 [Cryphonectria parasitica EP155]|uniref:RING-type domain-containing protein n=1 Tax=Cryphonectria parasitica (strain ATCC 38755 / EP155) TaxID=660469 RepID=A0A9P5CNV2_CRYP1|nr:uncharacterized protein M406DRAFT_91260 [Cryphonectria parasitica EP155]KAF3764717.1 hypothetical protein M406DRAFT_91260 [Cryphonectria parasitica EP155]
MLGNTYVDDIQNAVLLFSNPAWSGDPTIPSTIIKNITALSSDIAYSATIGDNITILTSKYASTENGIIQGLLYVPYLDEDDPCLEIEPNYVPNSAVRQADLPPSDYNLIALVPWYDPNCTKSYLASVSSDPIRAFLTYVPNNKSDRPPGVEDRQWDLHDHGDWRSTSKFPVYAISGAAGGAMMTELSLYSGNVSSVPYGDNITALYSPGANDYVRIWSEIYVATPNTLPTIWVFICVCIGVLLIFVALVSCLMHYTQHRRRVSLQQRVMSGEVNLEAMNIKRVRVPIEHVEKFPLFTYNYEPKSTNPPTSPISSGLPELVRNRDDGEGADQSRPLSEKAVSPSQAARSTITGLTINSVSTDYQPRCMICEEDFENRITIIRELSCGHIYHPECIDEFLSENSSLCPQCKASMLPKGYCPEITNAMVRRERALRRLRGSITVEDAEMESRPSRWRGNLRKKKLFRPSNSAANAVLEIPSRHSPTAETRLRMRDLAGVESSDGQSWDGRPRWKKITKTMFPGFR